MTDKTIELNVTPVTSPTDTSVFANYVYVGKDNHDVYVDFHLYDVNAANRRAADTLALPGARTVSVGVEAPAVARLVMSPALAQTLARLLQDYATADTEGPI